MDLQTMMLPRELWNVPRVEIDQYTAIPLACNSCFGTFRGREVGESCPACKAPSVPADQALPRPEVSDVPAAFQEDERLKRLLGRQWGLPAELRAIENLLTDLRARKKAAIAALADTRVRFDLKIASQRKLDDAEDAIAEYDGQIKRAEDKLDETVSVQRALNEQVTRIVAELREARAPEVISAAKAFAKEVLPHIQAIERAAAKAKERGEYYGSIFEYLTGVGHSAYRNGTGIAIGTLLFLEQNCSSRATRLQALTAFAEQAARLPK
jgi:hypothetical protein